MSPHTQHIPLLGRFGYLKRKNKHIQNPVMEKTYCCLPTWTVKPFLIFYTAQVSQFCITNMWTSSIYMIPAWFVGSITLNEKCDCSYTEKSQHFSAFGNIHIYCWGKSSTFVLLCRIFFHPMGFWAELMINAICLRGACIFHISL